jgi:hypothetical protein
LLRSRETFELKTRTAETLCQVDAQVMLASPCRPQQGRITGADGKGCVIAVTLPNFLVIGAQKAGTTALYQYLKQHPQIYMSPVKEPHFFSFEGEKPVSLGQGRKLTDHITHIEAYRRLFEGVSAEAAVGEASPSYIYIPQSAERIRHHVPEAKLIAVLRNPADRAYSNFLYAIKLGREPLTDFAQALSEEDARIQNGWGAFWHYKRKGFYYEQLERYFDKFDRNQIKIYLYEDLDAEPVVVLRDIFSFLGVDESYVPDISARHNVSGVPKSRTSRAVVTGIETVTPFLKRVLPADLRRVRESIRNKVLHEPPPLSAETREQLAELFREDILKLQNLIHRDLSAWLE